MLSSLLSLLLFAVALFLFILLLLAVRAHFAPGYFSLRNFPGPPIKPVFGNAFEFTENFYGNLSTICLYLTTLFLRSIQNCAETVGNVRLSNAHKSAGKQYRYALSSRACRGSVYYISNGDKILRLGAFQKCGKLAQRSHIRYPRRLVGDRAAYQSWCKMAHET